MDHVDRAMLAPASAPARIAGPSPAGHLLRQRNESSELGDERVQLTPPERRRVVRQVQVPHVQVVQKTVEVPQVQIVEKVVEVPVLKHVQVPRVTLVQKTVEVPQVQVVEVPIPHNEKLVGAAAAKDDGPQSVDRLGHADYAKALVKVLAGPVSSTPVTVGLYADWGSGKSHMMNQLMAEFSAINAANELLDSLDDSLLGSVDPYELQRPNYVSVWFNTWLYAGSANLWAGLIASLYDATEGHFGSGYCAALRLVKSSYYKYLVWPILVTLLALMLVAMVTLVADALPFFSESPLKRVTDFLLDEGILKEKDKKLIIATSVVSVLPLGMLQFFRTQADNLRKAASSPSWKEKIGHMADVKEELEYIGGLLREGPQWPLVRQKLLFPFGSLESDGDAGISIDGLSSVVGRFQDLNATLQSGQAQQDSGSQKALQRRIGEKWESLRRRGKHLNTASVDRKFEAAFPVERSTKETAAVRAEPPPPVEVGRGGPRAPEASARVVASPSPGDTYVPLLEGEQETAGPVLGPGGEEAEPQRRVAPWWEGFYTDSFGNLLNLTAAPSISDPTRGIPDPESIRTQQEAYQKSLLSQLLEGERNLDEQGRDSVRQLTDASGRERWTDQQLDSSRAQVLEQVQFQKGELYTAYRSQVEALEQQANKLCSDYEAAVKKREAASSGAFVPALVKCTTRPWLSGVREVAEAVPTALGRRSTVLRHADDGAEPIAVLSRGWHGLGTPRITWNTGSMAGETWYRQRKKSRGARFVVFVDDLDRCPPSKVAEVLQCIVLLTENTPFVIVLAIDPRLVVKAIEAAYDKSIVGAGMNGYAFLDKVVQLPFAIPRMTIDEGQQYVESFADEEVLGKDRNDSQQGNTWGRPGPNLQSREMLDQVKAGMGQQRQDWLSTLDSGKQEALRSLEDRTREERALLAELAAAARRRLAAPPSRPLIAPTIVAPSLISPMHTRELEPDGQDAPPVRREDTEEEIVEVPVPVVREEVVQVPVIHQQEQVHTQHVEQVVEVDVPMTQEEIVHVPVVVSQKVERLVEFAKASAGLLGPDELGLFRYLANFLDRNPRRIKRIMNIYAMSRELMSTRSPHSISQGADKAMLMKFIILCEQWPFRMSWIIHLLEDCQQMIVGTSQDMIDHGEYSAYCRAVGTYGFEKQFAAFPPPLPSLGYTGPPLRPGFDEDFVVSVCQDTSQLDTWMAPHMAAAEKRAEDRRLEIERAARLASWQMEDAYKRLLVSLEKQLTHDDTMEPVDISELYRFVEHFVYDNATWEAAMEAEAAALERRSILGMDSDPELFEAMLRVPPAITVDRIGSYRRRDPGRLASYLMNLNPALRSLVSWLAVQRQKRGDQYVSTFQAQLHQEVEENYQVRRLVQRVQAQMCK